MGNSCSGKPAAVPREPAPPARRRRTTSPLADARLSIAGGRPSVATKRMSDVSELTESDVSEQSEWDALLAQPAEETAVRVAIRSRPQIDGESATSLRGNHVSVGDTDFGPFDATLDDHSTQKATYDGIARNVVEQALRGFHGCVMAYGATGSGKTHAMAGERGDAGIVSRAIAQVFAVSGAEIDETHTRVECTYVEIYREQVRDLLQGDAGASENAPPPPPRGRALQAGNRTPPRAKTPPRCKTPPPQKQPRIREDERRGVFVDGCTRTRCRSAEECIDAFRAGSRRRAVRGTAKNDRSSRSHAVFTLELTRTTTRGAATVTQASRLHLVDLAGSERVKESKVMGDGVREAGNINQSLMVLGNVVTALEDKASKRRRGDVAGAARVHVPYRDAKLTRLLQDALGGNAYAAILCCVSRAAADASHTTSTLRFASRLKSVTTAPRKNLDPKDMEILRLRRENAKLRAALVDDGMRL